MIKNIQIGILAVLSVIAVTCSVTGCQSNSLRAVGGESSVQTGAVVTPSGQPVPPMAEQRRDKQGY